jgi:DNA-binding MarR family transcriptional regulator
MDVLPLESSQETHLVWLLAEAFAYTRQEMSQVVRRRAITSTQVGALYVIANEPRVSGTELARKLFITPQSAHQTIATLERKGLIKRQADPTGRAVRSALTASGRRLMEECIEDMNKVGGRLEAPMTPTQRAELANLLLIFLGRR